MKKRLLFSKLSLIVILISIGSCSKQKSPEQVVAENEILSSSGESRYPCEPDELLFVYEVEGYRLHRAIKACMVGFSVSKFRAKWNICIDKPSGELSRIDENGIVTGWGRIVDNEFELHFPIGLRSMPGFEDEDQSIFSIDEPMNAAPDGEDPIMLQPGQYKTSFNNQEILVRAPFLPGGAIISSSSPLIPGGAILSSN